MERIKKKHVHFQQMSAKDHNVHQLDSRQLRCCNEPARTKKTFTHNWFVVSGRPSSYECTWEESHKALTYSSAILVSSVLSNFPSATKARPTHPNHKPAMLFHNIISSKPSWGVSCLRCLPTNLSGHQFASSSILSRQTSISIASLRHQRESIRFLG